MLLNRFNSIQLPYHPHGGAITPQNTVRTLSLMSPPRFARAMLFCKCHIHVNLLLRCACAGVSFAWDALSQPHAAPPQKRQRRHN